MVVVVVIRLRRLGDDVLHKDRMRYIGFLEQSARQSGYYDGGKAQA